MSTTGFHPITRPCETWPPHTLHSASVHHPVVEVEGDECLVPSIPVEDVAHAFCDPGNYPSINDPHAPESLGDLHLDLIQLLKVSKPHRYGEVRFARDRRAQTHLRQKLEVRGNPLHPR